MEQPTPTPNYQGPERRQDSETRAMIDRIITLAQQEAKRDREALVRLLKAGIVALTLLILGVWAMSYFGSRDTVSAQRAGCERSAKDRAVNALGWRNAERARRLDKQIALAEVYDFIATDLESRSTTPALREVYDGTDIAPQSKRRIDCHAAFEDPSLWPWG